MRVRPIDLVDVFVYLVVLGVFIQLFPAVISESFLVALLTAVLLKIVLEGVLFVKKRIAARVRAPRGPWMRAQHRDTAARAPRKQAARARAPRPRVRRRRLPGRVLLVTLLVVTLTLARAAVRRAFILAA